MAARSFGCHSALLNVQRDPSAIKPSGFPHEKFRSLMHNIIAFSLQGSSHRLKAMGFRLSHNRKEFIYEDSNL
jgi:hypothetical protein